MVIAQVSTEYQTSAGDIQGPMVVGQTGDNRPRVDIAVSWASGDQQRKDLLLELLQERLSYRPEYRFALWVSDRDLLIGQDWNQVTLAAFRSRRVSMSLVSPAWLGSAYIQGKEWPIMLNTVHLPVGLVEIDLNSGPLRPPHLRPGDPPINTGQIFRHHGKFFGSLRNRIDREAWVDGLVKSMIKRLDMERFAGQNIKAVA